MTINVITKFEENIYKLNTIQLNLKLFYKNHRIWKKSDESYINMYYQPMDVMEDGITIDPSRFVKTKAI